MNGKHAWIAYRHENLTTPLKNVLTKVRIGVSLEMMFRLDELDRGDRVRHRKKDREMSRLGNVWLV